MAVVRYGEGPTWTAVVLPSVPYPEDEPGNTLEHPGTPRSGLERAEVLHLARERLVAELRAGGHLPACPCECGRAANAAALASVSRELRAVLSEIEALPQSEKASASGSLAAQVAALRAIADRTSQ